MAADLLEDVELHEAAAPVSARQQVVSAPGEVL
jgi:hypothetical protein